MRIRSVLLLGLTLLALTWATILTFAGGVAIMTPWGRLSSRDPIRPLALAVFAGVAFAAATSSRTAGDRGSSRWPSRLAAVIASVTLLAGLHFGTFTASASDASGYVSEAALWREGHPTRRAPEWVASAPWPDAARTAAPLGYFPGPVPGTQVPTYPAGLPLLMAAAHAVFGLDGEYYVVPIAAGLLVWATYLLGVRLSTPWGGLLAAALMASSPPVMRSLVQPMSDIPAAAGWTMAFVGALSGGVASAAAAGAATSLAILIRPNLVPLGAIVAFVIVRQTMRGRGRQLAAYGLAAAIGPVAVLLINRAVYGSPFQSGYGDLQALYSLSFVWPNIRRYTTWFLSAQTVVPLVGLLAVLCPRQRQDSSILAAITIGLPVLVLALYLPYTRFEEWSYLRFLLPAYPAVFAGLAVVAWNVAERWRDRRWVPPVLALGVGLLALRGLDYSNAPVDLSRDEQRYRLAADAVKTMPSNTIFVSFQHSGSLRFYTGRDILRWDLMDPMSIDAALDFLEARGFHLVWVGDLAELEPMRMRLAGSRFLGRLAASHDTRTIAGARLVDLGSPDQGAAVRR